jgi:hypothetical protein
MSFVGLPFTSEYQYLVYIDTFDGNKCKVRNNQTGQIVYTDATGTNPQTPIQSVISLGKDTYIAGGDYTFPAGFTPITWPTGIVFNVHCAKTAKFIVPSGYANPVFIMDATAAALSHCEFWGGQFEEAGTTSRNWYPFELKNGSAGSAIGNFFNKVGGYKVRQAKAMIKVSQMTTGGWLSSNMIEAIRGWDCKYAIEFYKDAAATGATKIYEHTFKDIKLQVDAATLTGVQNLRGDSNTFENVMIWDLDLGAGGAGAVSAWILSDAKYTRIRGGNMGTSLIEHPEYDQSANQDTTVDGGDFENRSYYAKWGSSEFTSPYVYGWWRPGSSTGGDGFLLGVAGANMAGSTITPGNISNTGGVFVKYATAASAQSTAGKRFNNVAMRNLNSRFGIRFRLAQATASQTRAWFGWTSGTSDPTGDTELNSKSGFMLVLRLADTNWQMGRNNGGATALYTDTGVAASNTNWHTLELRLDEILDRALWRLDGGFTAIGTTLPAQTTALNVHFGLQTNDGTARSFDMQIVELRNDRM